MSLLELPAVALVGVVGGTRALRDAFLTTHFDDDERVDVGREGLDRVKERLAAQRITAVDLTDLPTHVRGALAAAAKAEHTLRRAFLIAVPDEAGRAPPSRETLHAQGFRDAIVLLSVEDARSARVARVPLDGDWRHERGPFDLIGDVHGCASELEALLDRLGYERDAEGVFEHPDGRRVVFLGDLVDRGPRVVDVLAIAMPMVERGIAICVRGNHEAKLLRWLEGGEVKLTHGTQVSVEQLEAQPPERREAVRAFIESMPYYCALDEGALLVAHAGLKRELHLRAGGKVRAFALYGDTTGETDEYGLPVRLDWARSYDGATAVVYGHTPMLEARWVNNTICLDTGCVFGGRLTALRWPERELVSVPAEAAHYPPTRPLGGS